MRPIFITPAILLSAVFLSNVHCSGKSDPGGKTETTPQDGGSDGGPTPSPRCPAQYDECDGNPATVCESHLDSDPLNCGACRKSCAAAGAHQTSSCKAGSCAFACEVGFVDCDRDPSNGCESTVSLCNVVVLAELANPIGLAVDDTFVYYGSRGTSAADNLDGVLYKVAKDGSGTPIVLATNLNLPLNITIDDTHVYWSNSGHADLSDGSIASIPKTGGGSAQIKTIASGMMRPNNPVISGDRIYWTTRTKPTGFVYSAHKDGSDATPTLVASTVKFPSAMELAKETTPTTTEFLIWSSEGAVGDGSDALVERANLDGSNRTTLATGIVKPNYRLGIGADAVFVGSIGESNVKRVPFIGGPATLVTSGVGAPQEMLVDGTTLFVTTAFLKRVIAVPTTTTAGVSMAPVVLADEQTYPSYIAGDAESIYYTDGKLSEGTASIRKVKKPAK